MHPLRINAKNLGLPPSVDLEIESDRYYEFEFETWNDNSDTEFFFVIKARSFTEARRRYNSLFHKHPFHGRLRVPIDGSDLSDIFSIEDAAPILRLLCPNCGEKNRGKFYRGAKDSCIQVCTCCNTTRALKTSDDRCNECKQRVQCLLVPKI